MPRSASAKKYAALLSSHSLYNPYLLGTYYLSVYRSNTANGTVNNLAVRYSKDTRAGCCSIFPSLSQENVHDSRLFLAAASKSAFATSVYAPLSTSTLATAEYSLDIDKLSAVCLSLVTTFASAPASRNTFTLFRFPLSAALINAVLRNLPDGG